MPGLRSCAARYGFPASPDGVSHTTIRSFADFVDWISGNDGAASRGASDARMEALSRHWLPIFVRCARPTVTARYRLWTAEQETFLRQHQAQVQALIALAIKVITKAERQVGPSGGQP